MNNQPTRASLSSSALSPVAFTRIAETSSSYKTVGDIALRGPAPVLSAQVRNTSNLTHFAYGLVSGYIGAIAVYPIDLVKTKMQNQTAANMEYRNGFECFYKICSNNGYRTMWRGSITQLIGIGPEKAIKIWVNGFVSSQLPDDMRSKIIAGACAGASQVLVTNPIEIIKIQYQINHTESRSLLQALRDIGGVQNLYKGASMCLMRDIPFSSIYFPIYGFLKTYLTRDMGWSEKAAYFTSGMLAGIPAAFLVTPADVIKTRIQTINPPVASAAGASAGAVGALPSSRYRGAVDCAVQLVRYEGVTALYKGALWRVMKSAPQFGITLFMYEILKDFFADQP